MYRRRSRPRPRSRRRRRPSRATSPSQTETQTPRRLPPRAFLFRDGRVVPVAPVAARRRGGDGDIGERRGDSDRVLTFAVRRGDSDRVLTFAVRRLLSVHGGGDARPLATSAATSSIDSTHRENDDASNTASSMRDGPFARRVRSSALTRRLADASKPRRAAFAASSSATTSPRSSRTDEGRVTGANAARRFPRAAPYQESRLDVCARRARRSFARVAPSSSSSRSTRVAALGEISEKYRGRLRDARHPRARLARRVTRLPAPSPRRDLPRIPVSRISP